MEQNKKTEESSPMKSIHTVLLFINTVVLLFLCYQIIVFKRFVSTSFGTIQLASEKIEQIGGTLEKIEQTTGVGKKLSAFASKRLGSSTEEVAQPTLPPGE